MHITQVVQATLSPHLLLPASCVLSLLVTEADCLDMAGALLISRSCAFPLSSPGSPTWETSVNLTVGRRGCSTVQHRRCPKHDMHIYPSLPVPSSSSPPHATRNEPPEQEPACHEERWSSDK
ncbi:hypothetical protein P153DRAFT_38731 [Dothidotthia symphoricarpi CBS 119687]|uniref:Uncharacterized protein n=1 Tax=Dothidotthia symphoricarpi CBS 119687 TaxID=1392245 RepID=A0A6A6ACM3_9PLEO|nr:uncharacterized protein P153DRAFT_38731 [Dothidotthia symphoricarpi CBS 119687]KAF2128481.1 hypothetical protein P153DRAFT_38731 [Dothidotthia symphoricarpi CBS 119687]